jgi:hypothetical protein
MVRGYREQGTSFFVIQFKYLTEEPVRSVQTTNSPIELEVGVNSGRIYKIKVDVVKLRCDAVGLESLEKGVLGAIERFSANPPFNRLSDRYKHVQSAIFSNRQRPFSGAAGGIQGLTKPVLPRGR